MLFTIPVAFFLPGARRPVKSIVVPAEPTPYSPHPEDSTTPLSPLYRRDADDASTPPPSSQPSASSR